uniref:Uncharacterized protein n=1 Tax=viral metagenome TaxID=1070528 RepID=A0A6C0M0F3_9ZZZZ
MEMIYVHIYVHIYINRSYTTSTHYMCCEYLNM